MYNLINIIFLINLFKIFIKIFLKFYLMFYHINSLKNLMIFIFLTFLSFSLIREYGPGKIIRDYFQVTVYDYCFKVRLFF